MQWGFPFLRQAGQNLVKTAKCNVSVYLQLKAYSIMQENCLVDCFKEKAISLPFLPVSFLFFSLPKTREKAHYTWQYNAIKKMYEVAKMLFDSEVFLADFGEILLLVGWN